MKKEFPLDDDTKIPSVQTGEGRKIVEQTEPVITISLPYRSFWLLWEVAETKARQYWEKYAGVEGLEDFAEAYVDAVIEFRSAHSGTQVRRRAAEMPSKDALEDESAGRSKPRRKRRKRCQATREGQRCTGPSGHKSRHKDKHGNRW